MGTQHDIFNHTPPPSFSDISWAREHHNWTEHRTWAEESSILRVNHLKNEAIPQNEISNDFQIKVYDLSEKKKQHLKTYQSPDNDQITKKSNFFIKSVKRLAKFLKKEEESEKLLPNEKHDVYGQVQPIRRLGQSLPDSTEITDINDLFDASVGQSRSQHAQQKIEVFDDEIIPNTPEEAEIEKQSKVTYKIKNEVLEERLGELNIKPEDIEALKEVLFSNISLAAKRLSTIDSKDKNIVVEASIPISYDLSFKLQLYSTGKSILIIPDANDSSHNQILTLISSDRKEVGKIHEFFTIDPKDLPSKLSENGINFKSSDVKRINEWLTHKSAGAIEQARSLGKEVFLPIEKKGNLISKFSNYHFLNKHEGVYAFPDGRIGFEFGKGKPLFLIASPIKDQFGPRAEEPIEPRPELPFYAIDLTDLHKKLTDLDQAYLEKRQFLRSQDLAKIETFTDRDISRIQDWVQTYGPVLISRAQQSEKIEIFKTGIKKNRWQGDFKEINFNLYASPNGEVKLNLDILGEGYYKTAYKSIVVASPIIEQLGSLSETLTVTKDETLNTEDFSEQDKREARNELTINRVLSQEQANGADVSHLLVAHEVRVIGGTEGGGVALLTPYCDKGNLQKVLNSTKLNLEEKYRIAQQLIASVRELHALSIVHRDLKFDNFLASTGEDGQLNIKLADFGKSTFTKDNPYKKPPFKGDIFAIPYLASEAYWGSNANQYNKEVDHYSLGVILYQLFSEVEIPSLDETKRLRLPFELDFLKRAAKLSRKEKEQIQETIWTDAWPGLKRIEELDRQHGTAIATQIKHLLQTDPEERKKWDLEEIEKHFTVS